MGADTDTRQHRAARWTPPTLAVLAVLLRLPGLGRPGVLVFDEVFYAPDAADLLRWGSEHGRAVHPPLGKLLIGGGLAVGGFTPVGWRIASVLAGGVMVGLAADLVRRLTSGWMAAAVGGALVALDGLVHVTSRLALLDIFVALFTTAAVDALVASWQAQPDRRPARRALLLAAIAVGAAGAVKWSGLALVPLVVGVGWVIEGRLSAPGRPRRRGRAAVLVMGLALPFLFLVSGLGIRALGPDAVTPATWFGEQRSIAEFHQHLRPHNPNAAPAWTWVTQRRPARLFADGCVDHPAKAAAPCGPSRRIIAGANPAVWLIGLLGLVLGVVRTFRGDEESAIVVAAVALLWAPFALSPRSGYSFYAVALVAPLVALALRAAEPWRPSVRRVGGSIAVTAAIAMFALLWPLWTAAPLDHRQLVLRGAWLGWLR